MAARSWIFAVGWAGLAVAACTAEPAPANAPRQATVVRGDRGHIIGGEKMPRRVQWPAASVIDPRVAGELDADTSRALAGAVVPVLLPGDGELWSDAKIVTGEHYATVTCVHEGVTIIVQGSRLARLYPHLRGATRNATLRGVPAFVTRNEAVWSASWIEHGAAYGLEVACDAATDAHCEDETFLRRTAESLVYAGGEGAS